MKKILLSIAVIASAITTQAWELPFQYSINTMEQYMGKSYTTTTPSYENTHKDADGFSYRARMATMAYGMSGDAFATFSSEGNSILYYSGGELEGVFVGQRNEGADRVPLEVNLRTFYRSSSTPAKITNACIKSATISYHSIDDKVINLQSDDKTCTTEVREQGKIVKITPKIPTNTIHLSAPAQANVKGDSPYSKAYLNMPLAGVIIYSIKFELVDGKTYEEVLVDYDLYTKSLVSGVSFLSATTNSNGKDFASAHNGDVNSDGSVNAADVVSIYNNIISGAPTYKNHEYVDLGLPSKTLWASCNVGAYSPTGIGDFYGWYEFDQSLFNGKTIYVSNTRKYNSTLKAPAGWEGWSMPTKAQCEELISNTTLENGPNSEYVILKSKINGNQLILPTYGYVGNNGPFKTSTGYFWIDDNDGSDTAGMLKAYKTGMSISTDKKYYGNSLRLVIKK